MNEEVAAQINAKRPPVKIIIDRVTFENPIHLSNSSQRELVTQLKQIPIDDSEDWLQEIRDVSVTGAWRNEGFRNVQVTAQISEGRVDSVGHHVALEINVNEGQQFRLGEVMFRSSDADRPLVFPVGELKKYFLLREGDVFNESKVRDGIDALKALYGSHGYIDFVAIPLVDVDDKRLRISLVMELDQEQQFRIGKVEVFSSSPQFEQTARLNLKSGDIFDIRTVKNLLKDNAALLPPDISDEDLVIHRDVRSGIVDIRLNLEPCPQVR
jgi:hypothetical protein